MTIGLVDVDGRKSNGTRFPNLALMKLSSYHRQLGDDVEFGMPLKRYDIVYRSKIFTFTKDDDTPWMAKAIISGGTGYGLIGRLEDNVEHTMPDYSLYGISDTAFGFLSRGCPRGCPFCIVSKKEGRASLKVADLREWWNGQSNIKLLDPNITACPDWRELFGQLKESNAWIDFTQGLDIRLLNDEKVEALNSLKVKMIHFAWDGNENLEPLFREFAPKLRYRSRDRRVYVLTNYNTTREFDMHRIILLRDLGYDPYVMIYDKQNADRYYRRVQRWCNNKFIFNSTKWEDYK